MEILSYYRFSSGKMTAKNNEPQFKFKSKLHNVVNNNFIFFVTKKDLTSGECIMS